MWILHGPQTAGQLPYKPAVKVSITRGAHAAAIGEQRGFLQIQPPAVPSQLSEWAAGYTDSGAGWCWESVVLTIPILSVFWRINMLVLNLMGFNGIYWGFGDAYFFPLGIHVSVVPLAASHGARDRLLPHIHSITTILFYTDSFFTTFGYPIIHLGR